MTDHARKAAFKTLNISPDADSDAIKAAWRRLIRSYHPSMAKKDPVAANRILQEINAAFDVISGVSPKTAPRKDMAERRAPNRHSTTRRHQTKTSKAPEPYVVPDHNVTIFEPDSNGPLFLRPMRWTYEDRIARQTALREFQNARQQLDPALQRSQLKIVA